MLTSINELMGNLKKNIYNVYIQVSSQNTIACDKSILTKCILQSKNQKYYVIKKEKEGKRKAVLRIDIIIRIE